MDITVKLLLSLLFAIMTLGASGAPQNTIRVEIPGTLEQLIPESDRLSMTSVRLSCFLDMSDIMLLREMAGAKGFDEVTQGMLTDIDISEVSIIRNDKTPYLVMGEDSLYSKDNELGDFAFYNCTNLKTLELPTNLERIGGQALGWCKSLEEIKLPETLKEIGFAAFTFCESVESLTIPECVTELGIKCFEWMSSLRSLRLNESIRVLPSEATTRLYNLESIYFGKGLRLFDEDMFFYLPALKSVEVSEDNLKYRSVNGILFTKDLTEMVAYPNNYDGESYTIPHETVAIADYCFGNARNLIDIVIPGHVKTIGNYAFWFCEKLESAVLEEGVESIGDSGFESCFSLKYIHLPSTLCRFGAGALNLTYSLSSIDLSPANESLVIDDNALYSSDKRRLFYVNSFASDYFEQYATDPEVMIVESGALCYLPELKTLTFGDRVRSIKRNAVSSAFKLESVEIGKNVTHIDVCAMASCPELINVYCKAHALSDVSQKAFAGSPLSERGTLYVPVGTLDFYLNQNWVYDPDTRIKYFANVVEMDFSGVKESLTEQVWEPTEYITPDGKIHSTPQPGLNIARASDGLVRKIMH